jgi:predicted RNase H-like nuclease
MRNWKSAWIKKTEAPSMIAQSAGVNPANRKTAIFSKNIYAARHAERMAWTSVPVGLRSAGIPPADGEAAGLP